MPMRFRRGVRYVKDGVDVTMELMNLPSSPVYTSWEAWPPEYATLIVTHDIPLRDTEDTVTEKVWAEYTGGVRQVTLRNPSNTVLFVKAGLRPIRVLPGTEQRVTLYAPVLRRSLQVMDGTVTMVV